MASLLIISANLGGNVLLDYSPVITWASSNVCSSPVPSTFSISSYSDIIEGDKTYITDTVVFHSIQYPA